MNFDILISGAGPAGLCLARALSGHGLRIGLVEQQPLAALEQPAFDGREIALTQPSAQQLRTLGLWRRIEALAPHALSPLRDARVLNGPSPFAMVIGHGLGTHSELGWLVSNHLIRRAAFDAVQDARQTHGDITLLAGEQVAGVRTDAQGAHVTLASGGALQARLLVAADSRFSATRRAMGIAADLHDFGRSMLVCSMTHEAPHHHAAWEWFDYGQTLALLPMNDDPASGAHRASVVLTLPSHEIEPLLALDPAAFGHEMTRRFLRGAWAPCGWPARATPTRWWRSTRAAWWRSALPASATPPSACTRSRRTALTLACSASARWPAACWQPMPPGKTLPRPTCWPATRKPTAGPPGRSTWRPS